MDRRTFVGAVAGALLTSPLAIEAQQAGRVRRIGYRGQNSTEALQHQLDAFRQGLRERGWVEGRNVLVEIRFAEGKVDQLPALVAELIRLKVDIIVTTSSATTWAAKDATTSIPIVMAVSADALGEGLVTSLAHPGGNITGMTFLVGPEIAGKHLELLKEGAPAASRVAVLTNSTNRSHATLTRELMAAARAFGVQLHVFDARSPDQLDSAFAAMTRERAAALLVLTDAVFVGQRQRVADLAARSRLPAMYYQREFVDAGGAHLLRSESFGHVPPCRDTCLQGPERRQAQRHSHRATHEVRTGDQPQDREGARDHDPAIAASARGRGHPIT